MILLDNIIFELQRVGGVSKYWAETIKRLDRSSLEVEYLEGSNAVDNQFRGELSLTGNVISERGPASLRRIFNPRQPSEIFHSSYYRTSPTARANVVTIHDFMNEKFGNGFRDTILSRMKRAACKKADYIITVSETTRRDLIEEYPFVDPSKVQVIYNGVDQEFFPENLGGSIEVESDVLPVSEFFLYVGSRGVCKNFSKVLDFVGAAQKRGAPFPLAYVGSRLSESELKEAEARGIVRAKLVHCGNVSNAQLRRLYSNCCALLIPSLYEGFGIPAAEAARCGALVITAKGSALDEVVGDSLYALDLQKPHEIDRVLDLGLNSLVAKSERQKMQRNSLQFSWDRSVQQLIDVYERL